MGNKHFFIIGGQRCGTTYLYNLLDEHPEIEMAKPLKPEPKFFLKNYITEDELQDYYKKFFTKNSNNYIKGEKSTSYYEYDNVASHISALIPNVKIIMILRDPIERAISNYKFSVEHKLENIPIEQALFQENQHLDNFDKNKISASPFAYLKRGLYIDYINIYDKYFDQNSFKIILFEKLISNVNTIKEIYEFLEVDRYFKPSKVKTITNASKQNKSLEISSDLREKLKKYFLKYNKLLSNRINDPLEAWPSMHF